MSKKIIIIGGVAGGASCAARLRRLDEEATIIMLERGEYISFANCGLPYYIGDEIKERDQLLVQTPEKMNQRFRIDVRVLSEAVEIDKEQKKILVKDLKTGESYEEGYDYLVISTGSTPLKPPIEGIDSPNIFSLWNIPDTDRIKAYLEEKKPKSAAVIGGGFIGVEMAENLKGLGIEVHLVELADQIMAPFDYEMAQILHGHVEGNGVKLHLKDGVQKFSYREGKTTIQLQSGNQIETDMVILSIGIRPNGELAKKAGLDVNPRGGILTDAHLRTSDEHIYAIGDVIEVRDPLLDGKTMIPLAGPANKQGRICADNIHGGNETYEGSIGTSVVKVFEMTASATGYNEKMLEKKGLVYGKDYFVTVVKPNDHAGYYPGALPMTLKLIFDAQGKVLGAQNIGYQGVEKRIDVIASAIHFKGSIYDLKELELSYAPPFSSAKDPVNMAGFSAENILSQKVDVIRYKELENLSPEHVLLDVREPSEQELGFIPDAINIPVDALRERLSELDPQKTYVVYCAVGIRGYIACRILTQHGFKAKNLIGGYKHYDCSKGESGNCSFDIGVSDTGESEKKNDTSSNEKESVTILHCEGLQCPGPIMQVSEKIQTLKEGDVLEILASDPGFTVDIRAWCKKRGHQFLTSDRVDKAFRVRLRKGGMSPSKTEKSTKDSQTMVVFSGDLDKAIASFIIANGARAMGKEVTMFFTFWGLNILRKDTQVVTKKSFIEGMFGKMMPRGANRLKLSKMHMMGMGSKMMKKVMKDKNVESLSSLMEKAIEGGVKIVACTMSMDVMGLKKEELIEGIHYGGVAAYLGEADESNINLFI